MCYASGCQTGTWKQYDGFLLVFSWSRCGFFPTHLIENFNNLGYDSGELFANLVKSVEDSQDILSCTDIIISLMDIAVERLRDDDSIDCYNSGEVEAFRNRKNLSVSRIA